MVVLNRYGDASDDILLGDGDGKGRGLGVFLRQLDFCRGRVAGFVGDFQLELAFFGEFVSRVDGLGGAVRRGEGKGDGAGGGDVVFPGGDGCGADLEFAAGEGGFRDGDDVHGARGDRDRGGLDVLRRRSRWCRIDRLLAAAGDNEQHRENGGEQIPGRGRE